MPAYDLVPMDRYGTSKLLFKPGGTTIHHPVAALYCALLRLVDPDGPPHGDRRGMISLRPRWRPSPWTRRSRRSKSSTTSTTSAVMSGWTSPVHRRSMERPVRRRDHSLWDGHHPVRLHAQRPHHPRREARHHGEARRRGLRHLCIGVERASEPWDFAKASTTTISSGDLRILDKYPSIFKQATFIVGTRYETRSPCSARRNSLKS